MTLFLYRSAWASVLFGFEGLRELQNIHPVFVHFPIGLFSAAALFYFAGACFKKDDLLIAGKWTLLLGTVSAIFAVWSGTQAAGSVSHGGGTHAVMELHEKIGYGIVGLSLALSVWILFSNASFPQGLGRPLFLIGLLILAALVVQTADLGGRMVFLNGVGVGRKSMLKELDRRASKSHHDHHGSHEHPA